MPASGPAGRAVEGEWDDERLAAGFAAYGIDHLSKDLFRARTRHELQHLRCSDCGYWSDLPTTLCPKCWSTRVEPTRLSGRGVVHSYTYEEQPDGSSRNPLVLVELEEQPGLRLAGPLVGSPAGPDLIGIAVRLTWTTTDAVPTPSFRLDEP